MKTYLEVASAIPCTIKDIRKLVTKNVVSGTLPETGRGLLFSDEESDKIAAIINKCPYLPTDATTGRYERECSKGCGTVAKGFEDVEKIFGFSKVKAGGYRRSRSLCRDCHRKYKDEAEATEETPVEVPRNTMNSVAALKEIKPAHAAEVARVVHRKPYESTVTIDDAEQLSFGPIKLDVIDANTPEGSTMIPNRDPNFSLGASETLVLAVALKNAESTWIWGPSGVGKTSGVKQIASILNWPVYRVQMSADFSLDDFVGTTEVVMTPTGAVTKFVDGVLIRAMLNGGILLIDEFTGTPPHVLLALQAVLENVPNPVQAWEDGESHTTFVNTSNGGEVVHAHKNFRIIVTDNTNGQGDSTGLFAGTNVMNEATRSRFSQWFRKDFPSKEEWIDILHAKEPKLHIRSVQSIVEVAITSNKQSRALGAPTGVCDLIINPRDTLAVARLAGIYGSVSTAFMVSIGNAIDPTHPDAVYIRDLLKNIVGAK
jgi:MoxR-like ATPase